LQQVNIKDALQQSCDLLLNTLYRYWSFIFTACSELFWDTYRWIYTLERQSTTPEEKSNET